MLCPADQPDADQQRLLDLGKAPANWSVIAVIFGAVAVAAGLCRRNGRARFLPYFERRCSRLFSSPVNALTGTVQSALPHSASVP
jgi:hypothetical protein